MASAYSRAASPSFALTIFRSSLDVVVTFLLGYKHPATSMRLTASANRAERSEMPRSRSLATRSAMMSAQVGDVDKGDRAE